MAPQSTGNHINQTSGCQSLISELVFRCPFHVSFFMTSSVMTSLQAFLTALLTSSPPFALNTKIYKYSKGRKTEKIIHVDEIRSLFYYWERRILRFFLAHHLSVIQFPISLKIPDHRLVYQSFFRKVGDVFFYLRSGHVFGSSNYQTTQFWHIRGLRRVFDRLVQFLYFQHFFAIVQLYRWIPKTMNFISYLTILFSWIYIFFHLLGSEVFPC